MININMNSLLKSGIRSLPLISDTAKAIISVNNKVFIPKAPHNCIMGLCPLNTVIYYTIIMADPQVHMPPAGLNKL